MIGEEVGAGVCRWTAYHEEWKEQVGCTAIGRGDRLILIDPLLDADGWVALEPVENELDVLLTIHWHARSTAELLARRPATRVWAHSRDRAAVGRRTPVTEVFSLDDPLPGGLEARPCRRSTEVLFWDPEARALIAGDALIGGDGGIRPCPASWLPSGATADEMRDSLRPLLELPIELLLVSHGEPVLAGGRAALAAGLEAS